MTIALDKTTLNLQAVLSAAASIQPEVTASFQTWNVDGEPTKPATHRTVMNSTTDVTILPAPGVAGQVREPLSIVLYNKDGVTHTATVKSDDGTTEIILQKVLLGPAETLAYEKGRGWYSLSATGATK